MNSRSGKQTLKEAASKALLGERRTIPQ